MNCYFQYKNFESDRKETFNDAVEFAKKKIMEKGGLLSYNPLIFYAKDSSAETVAKRRAEYLLRVFDAYGEGGIVYANQKISVTKIAHALFNERTDDKTPLTAFRMQMAASRGNGFHLIMYRYGSHFTNTNSSAKDAKEDVAKRLNYIGRYMIAAIDAYETGDPREIAKFYDNGKIVLPTLTIDNDHNINPDHLSKKVIEFENNEQAYSAIKEYLTSDTDAFGRFWRASKEQMVQMFDKISASNVLKAMGLEYNPNGILLTESPFKIDISDNKEWLYLYATELFPDTPVDLVKGKIDALKYIVGQIDAIYVDPNSNTVYVIDYKSHIQSQFGKAGSKVYAFQIETYAEKIRQIFGGEVKVKSSLISIEPQLVNDFLSFNITNEAAAMLQDETQARYQMLLILRPVGVKDDTAAQISLTANLKLANTIPGYNSYKTDVQMLKQDMLTEKKTVSTMTSVYTKGNKNAGKFKDKRVDLKRTRENYSEGGTDNKVYFVGIDDTMDFDDFIKKETSIRLVKTKTQTESVIKAYEMAKLQIELNGDRDGAAQILSERLLSITENNRTRATQFARNIMPYLRGDWKIIEIEELMQMGILLFKLNDEVQIVRISPFGSNFNEVMNFGNTITKVDDDGEKRTYILLNPLADDGSTTDTDFLKLNDKGMYHGYRNGQLNPTTYGEYQLLTALAIFELFRPAIGDLNIKVTRVKCISTRTGNATVSSLSVEKLHKSLDFYRNHAKNPAVVASPENVVYANSLMAEIRTDVMNLASSLGDKYRTDLNSIEDFRKMRQLLRTNYPDLLGSSNKLKYDTILQSEAGLLYTLLGTLINLANGYNVTELNKVNNYALDRPSTIGQIASIVRDGQVLNYMAGGFTVSGFFQGATTASAFNNPDNLVNLINRLCQEARNKIESAFDRDAVDINNAIDKYLNGKASIVERYIFGNTIKYYEDLIKKDSTGAISMDMQFRNPYTDSMVACEKECLEVILWNINKYKIRFLEKELPLEASDRNLSLKEFKRTRPNKYEAYVRYMLDPDHSKALDMPLRRGSSDTRVQGLIENRMSFKNFFKNAKENLEKDFDPRRYTTFEQSQADEDKQRMIFHNRFKANHDEIIKEHQDPYYFDLNINGIALDSVLESLQETYYNETLQNIECVIGTIRMAEYVGGEDYSDKLKNIIDRVTISIYGENVLDAHLKDANRLVGKLKGITSYLKIAARPLLWVKEVSVSGSKLWIKAATGYLNSSNGITRENFEKAYALVLGQEASNLGKIVSQTANGSLMSLVGRLNCKYSIANSDQTVVTRTQRTDRFGLLGNVQRMLFSTSTSPDFYNRMSIFVALMMSDGCWEAHSLDKDTGELIYNFAKDKRFSKYWAQRNNKNITDLLVLKQKAHYLFLLNEMRTEGFTNPDGSMLKEGDPLPQAYSSRDISAIKETIGTTLGFYDHDQQTTFMKLQYAFLHFQFAGYLAGENKNWFNTNKNSFTGSIVQGKDENGNKLYIVKDAEGNEMKDENGVYITTTESVDANGYNLTPFMVFEGHPVEGLMISLLKTARDINHWQEFEKKRLFMKEDPNGEHWQEIQLLNNAKTALIYLILGQLIAAILVLIFANADKDKQEAVKKLEIGYNLLGKRIAQEFDPIDSIFNQFVGLEIKGVKTATDLLEDFELIVAAGDPKKLKRVKNAVSSFKDIDEIVDKLNLQ